ncbi:MAG TPA: GtrA family protein [Trebonia sp.]|nr:GtrA family protein [Trebonia sp.]
MQRSALRRLTESFTALSDSRSASLTELGPETGPFAGVSPSAQMMGLRHQQYIAEAQASAMNTALASSPRRPRGALSALWRARKRLLIFAANGLLVFVFGVAVQYALIHYWGMGHVKSYVIQTVLSVPVNFLLSRYLTWRDRHLGLGSALVRYNVQQLTSTGLGMAAYAGLEHFDMNYLTANVVVTAVLTPVSFVIGNQWSMAERSASLRLRDLPWPLLVVLVIQILLSMRMIWSNTAFIDEATYLYVGSQDLNHWIHGIPIRDYQTFMSGAPVVYPPIAAIVNAVGGLVAVRFLSLAFMVGANCLLYVTTSRLFDKWTALAASAVWAGLAGTQFLGALATYDAMALFLLALSAYLVLGRKNAYDTLTDVAISTVTAGAVLALANADKYATALWDPVVIGLAFCAPPMAGYAWRYGIGRALRVAVTLGAFLAVGLAVGKAKYVQGILYTTVNRSSSQLGMGQPASLVLHDAWKWVGYVVVLAIIGALFLLGSKRRFPDAMRGALLLLGLLLVLAALAAPLNQARIGTSVSLQKHVDFGAWFGCIIAGYAITRVLRFRVLIGLACCALIAPLAATNAITAQGYYTWPTENMAFIAALKTYVRPGDQKYLISGYDDIPGYYINYVSSIQWKEAGTYSYLDPQSGQYLLNGPAFADAIKHRVFTLIILNFAPNNGPDEPANDYLIAADIAKYGTYKVVGHLPPSESSSNNFYTVWRVTGAN